MLVDLYCSIHQSFYVTWAWTPDLPTHLMKLSGSGHALFEYYDNAINVKPDEMSQNAGCRTSSDFAVYTI